MTKEDLTKICIALLAVYKSEGKRIYINLIEYIKILLEEVPA